MHCTSKGFNEIVNQCLKHLKWKLSNNTLSPVFAFSAPCAINNIHRSLFLFLSFSGRFCRMDRCIFPACNTHETSAPTKDCINALPPGRQWEPSSVGPPNCKSPPFHDSNWNRATFPFASLTRLASIVSSWYVLVLQCYSSTSYRITRTHAGTNK